MDPRREGRSQSFEGKWLAVPNVEVLTVLTDTLQSVAFAPDGRRVAAAGADGRVIVWDAGTGKVVKEWLFPGLVSCVVFAPDGRHLATGNSNGTAFVLRLPAALLGQ